MYLEKKVIRKECQHYIIEPGDITRYEFVIMDAENGRQRNVILLSPGTGCFPFSAMSNPMDYKLRYLQSDRYYKASFYTIAALRRALSVLFKDGDNVGEAAREMLKAQEDLNELS